MSRQPRKFYRFRPFDTNTVESLCNDTLFFARPSTFNDPLDCNPTLDNDSEPGQLRDLLTLLIRRRVSKEVLASLERASVRGDKANAHAERRARYAAEQELTRIDYYATDPDYPMSVEEAKAWLLTREIEDELLLHYERGVCCFSTASTSPLLWSHYADQHRGLCIGYDLDRLPKPSPRKVVYGGSRFIKTSTVFRTFVADDVQAKADLDRDVLLRKAKGWGYECEWRLVERQGLHDSPVRLTEVIFGLRCPSAVVFAVVEMLSRRDLNFFQMTESRGQFRLKRQVLDLGDIQSSYPRTAQSGEEMFPDIENAL